MDGLESVPEVFVGPASSRPGFGRLEAGPTKEASGTDSHSPREGEASATPKTVSIALANQATLVNRDLKDFRQVLGLRLENWAD